MLARLSGILCFIGWLVLLWAGCCREQGGIPCGSVKFDGACKRDADCQSGLCDRGLCADERDFGDWKYGLRCEPTYAPHPLEDTRFPGNMDPCGGYVCVDGRCRSCESDAECQTGRPEYRCFSYHSLPGSGRCGDPDEFIRHPGSPQPWPRTKATGDPSRIVPSIPPRSNLPPPKYD